MNNNFPTIRQNADIILSKTKRLMGIGNKILAKKSELSQNDDNWMERLWAWADENDVPDLQWWDDEGSWSGLPRDKNKLLLLTELCLDHNRLSDLPNEIGNLANLKVLNVRANNLSKLPNEIGKLTHLTHLDASENELTELSPEIGRLTNLIKLDVWGNQLTEIPQEIGNLTNLIELNIYENQIVKIPKEIGNLTNLTSLIALSNQLTELPKEIGNLINLVDLSVSENGLSELPSEIGNLTSLTQLDVSKNELTELPPEIGNLTNLIRLFIWDNYLTELPLEIANLTHLTVLSAWDNCLTEVPGELEENGTYVVLDKDEWIEKLQENENSDQATDDLLERIGKFDTETILTTSYNMMQEVIEDSNGTTPLSNHAVFLNWDDTIKALQMDNGDALIKFEDGTGYGLNFGDGKVIIIVKEIDGTPAFVNLKFYEKFYKEILQNSY